MRFLYENRFIQAASASNSELKPTALGVATALSGIAPTDAVQILEPLAEANKRLILGGGLHPVFLVTPPSANISIHWQGYATFLQRVCSDLPNAQLVAKHLGIKPSKADNFLLHPPPSKSCGLSEKEFRLYKRFYTAVLLFALVQEWPIPRVLREMPAVQGVSRGQLQTLQKDAAAFCGMTVVFCKKLHWDYLAACLEDFSARLSFGVGRDLLPLVKIGSEVTASRARALLMSGIENAKDIVEEGEDVIAAVLFEALPFDRKIPTTAAAADLKGPAAAKGGSNSNSSSGSGSNNRESSFRACTQLARKIVRRAKDSIELEIKMLNQESLIFSSYDIISTTAASSSSSSGNGAMAGQQMPSAASTVASAPFAFSSLATNTKY